MIIGDDQTIGFHNDPGPLATFFWLSLGGIMLKKFFAEELAKKRVVERRTVLTFSRFSASRRCNVDDRRLHRFCDLNEVFPAPPCHWKLRCGSHGTSDWAGSRLRPGRAGRQPTHVRSHHNPDDNPYSQQSGRNQPRTNEFHR